MPLGVRCVWVWVWVCVCVCVCVCVWVWVCVCVCAHACLSSSSFKLCALYLVCSGDRLRQSARTRGASKGGCDRVVGVFGCTCACVCMCGCADVLQDYFI